MRGIVKTGAIVPLILVLHLFILGMPFALEQEKLVSFQLPNGMKVIIKEKRAAPVVAIQVWVRAGSSTEKEKEAGITHLIEHMIFKGTPRRPVGQVAREIEACGGRINAYTSYDYTVYHVTIASRFFQKGIDVIADVMGNSIFDPGELEREKEVVLEEIRMGEDDPSRRLSRVLFREAYRVHPYGRPIIGYSETVKALTRADLLAYFSRWYSANNMLLVVVGDIEIERAKKEVERSFSYIPREVLPARKKWIEPEQKGLRLALLEENVKEAYLSLAFHIPHAGHRDTYGIDCLAFILGEGESSRLYQEVKAKRELVRSISAYAYTPLDPGLFVINARLDPKNLKRALNEIYRTMIKVGSEGLNDEELKKAKINIEKDLIYERETVQGEAEKLGYFEVLFGDCNFEREYLKHIQAVTDEDIRRIVREYFRSSNLTIAIIVPKGIEAGIENEGLIRTFKEMEGEFLPLPEKEGGPLKGKSQVLKRVLPNGIRVIVKEDRSVPIVSVQAVFLGGLRFERPENNGINNFMVRMLTKGTERRNAFELAKRIEGIAGEITGFSGRNSFGLSARFLSRFLPEGMELFSEILLHPGFIEEEMEKMRRTILAEIDREEDDIARFSFLQFTKNLYRIHPYGMRVTGERESISGIKREDLIHYYRKYVVPENMVLCLVGDIDPERAFSMVENYFGGSGGSPFHPPSVSKEPPLVGKVELKVPMEKRQIHIVLGFPSTTIFSPDRYPMEVLNTILSAQGGRLFLELRDREGLAYAVDSFFIPGIDPGFFGIYMATSPEKVKRAEEGIKRELQRILTQGVTEEEVQVAKENIVGNFEIGLQSYSSQAMTMALDELYGLGYDEVKRYPERILTVTREDVMNVARKYIDLDRYLMVIVGPVAVNEEKRGGNF